MEGRGLDPSQWVFLTFREKLWVTLEYPSSGPVAFALSAAILLLIAFSTVTYCAQTLHGVYRHDLSRNSFWFASEAFCASCFTAEFAARLYASPDRRVFAKDSMNIIDIVAIVPFYVDLIADAASGGSSEAIPGLAVIRVFRMARVFRLLRMSRSSADLFAETAANSVRALTMLLLVIGIGLVVFSSLMYFIERGRWDERLRVWERPRGYACEVTVTSSSFAHPNSFDQVSKPNLGKNQSVGTVAAVSFSAGAHHPCAFVSMRDDALAATFLCEYAFEKNRECATLYEQSPFDSVLRSMWWTWVTATTVGYGDVNPRSILGKTMGGVVMSFGVLVLALPVTVVGSNFSAAFHRDAAKRKARAKKERLRERKRLASHMNSAASSPSFSRLTSLNEI
jgi:signal transduction histidine kinase